MHLMVDSGSNHDLVLNITLNLPCADLSFDHGYSFVHENSPVNLSKTSNKLQQKGFFCWNLLTMNE